MRHILLIASDAPSLINFRLDLIKDLLSKDYKVSVLFPKSRFSEQVKKSLKYYGVNVNFFKLSRAGINVFQEFKSIISLYK